MTSLAQKSLILIGAGGHAKVVMDAVLAQGGKISGYVDPKPAAWLDAQGIPHITEAEFGLSPQLIMGFVGLDCEALKKRYHMMQHYQQQGVNFPSIIHPSAIISPNAHISEGVQVLLGAVINAYARVEPGVVINSVSVVEHDAVIGAGAHIAPASVVLGGANIGECAYVGSQAVIVQNSELLPYSFVKALTVHK